MTQEALHPSGFPDQSAVRIAAEHLSEVFYVHSGITSKQIDQLIAFTVRDSQSEMLTRDRERFMSRDQYSRWAAKGRTVYTLTDRPDGEGDLKGIFWIGEKPLPERTDYTESLDPDFYRYTYAFRLYDSAKGKRLAHHVLAACIDRFLGTVQLPVGMWEEINKANAVSIRMSQREGARLVTGREGYEHVVLVTDYPQRGFVPWQVAS